MRCKCWLLLLCAVLTLLAVSSAQAACSASTCSTQGEADGLCENERAQHPEWESGTYATVWSCRVTGTEGTGGYDPALGCYVDTAYYGLGNYSTGLYSFNWCQPTCVADQQTGDALTRWPWAEPGSKQCDDGCYRVFHPTPGISSLCFTSTSQCMSQGYYVTDGTRCASASTAPPAVPSTPPKPCGGGSCYDPVHGYCAVTDSGEQFCTGDDPQPGKCVVGATGAMCLGDSQTPPPSPPDPPIPPGQPPDHSDQVNTTTTDSGGGSTTNTTTINNFNGSDTQQPGSTAGSGSSTGGTSDGGVGGSSNNDGSGNTGKNGTDDNGKCPDGSVPTASGCAGTFSDGGCDSPPACAGDAVMCGQAKETWAMKCAQQKGNDWLQKHVDDLEPVPTPLSGSVISDQDVGGSSFDQTGLGWGRTCPTDPTFEIYGKTYTLPLADMCNVMGICGDVLLVIAQLYALAIVARGRV